MTQRHARRGQRQRSFALPAGPSGGGPEDRAVTILVAEYQYVSSLIPFYRNVEMLVLAGTGLVTSGAVAAVAALTGGEHPDPTVAAGVLAAAAWGPTLLLVVEITALTRIARASRYIQTQLIPLAQKLSGESQILQFECAPTEVLTGEIAREHRLYRSLVSTFASSLGVLLIPVLAAFALTIGAVLFNGTGVIWGFGGLACLLAVGAMGYGYSFTSSHERREAGVAI
jgi:hypothetical protein